MQIGYLKLDSWRTPQQNYHSSLRCKRTLATVLEWSSRCLALEASNKRQIHSFNIAPTGAKRMGLSIWVLRSFHSWHFCLLRPTVKNCTVSKWKKLFITEVALLQLRWQTWQNAKEDLMVCLQMSSERYNWNSFPHLFALIGFVSQTELTRGYLMVYNLLL